MPSKPKVYRPPHIGTVEQARRQYDLDRGSARARGYDARWDKASAAFKRDHPLCLGCQAVGWNKPTEVVDHVEPHQGDMIKFWNPAMWQPCCAWHHDVVKQRLEGMLLRGEAELKDLHLDSAKAMALTRSLGPP